MKKTVSIEEKFGEYEIKISFDTNGIIEVDVDENGPSTISLQDLENFQKVLETVIKQSQDIKMELIL
jgi:hypothetical protein